MKTTDIHICTRKPYLYTPCTLEKVEYYMWAKDETGCYSELLMKASRASQFAPIAMLCDNLGIEYIIEQEFHLCMDSDSYLASQASAKYEDESA